MIQALSTKIINKCIIIICISLITTNVSAGLGKDHSKYIYHVCEITMAWLHNIIIYRELKIFLRINDTTILLQSTFFFVCVFFVYFVGREGGDVEFEHGRPF